MSKTHGHTHKVYKNGKIKVVRSITYMSWEAMNARCYRPSHKWYHIYGGRGIEVCERWRIGTPNAFANFLADMGERPEKSMTLDRKDANLNYTKNNCRWADKSTQRTNQRNPFQLDVEPVNTIPF